MLAGQVADGITTPLVGLGSDRCKTPIGARAPWYIAGTLIVIPCFFAIFLSPFGVGDNTLPAELPDPKMNTGKIIGFYAAIASLFNIGWASVQIANMSVVNSLTYSTQNRDILVASRNTFTYIANITVLITSLILFSIQGTDKDNRTLSSKSVFLILGSIICGLGILTSLVYITTLKEPYLSKEAKRLQKEFKLNQQELYKAEKGEKERAKSMSMQVKAWYSWFKEGQFYLYGVVYTLVRMAVNVVMTVSSLYLIVVLQFKEGLPADSNPVAVALTPLISYSFSLLFQLFVYKRMLKIFPNRFVPMFIAIFVTTAGAVPFFLLGKESRNWVYVCSPFV